MQENIYQKYISGYSNEDFKSIEVSKEEIEALKSIDKFLNKLVMTEELFDNGPIGFKVGTKKLIDELYEQKKSKLTEDSDPNLFFKAKREAEYEAGKDVIEYKNQQLEKLINYIESFKIWKHKFSTSSSISYNKYSDFRFSGDGKESNEYDILHTFAGQSKDSIYYISKGGASLRLKKSLLFSNDIEFSIKKVMQKAQDLVVFRNWEMEINENKSDWKTKEKWESFPAKDVSLTPKLGFYVEEFYSNEFDINSIGDGGYKSKIKLENNNKEIIIKNFDNAHSGHQVNRNFFNPFLL
jgi:hypothetical protein